jgi:hypothetical protein
MGLLVFGFLPSSCGSVPFRLKVQGLTGAELLIDCEEYRVLRAVLVGMLREADH